MNHTEYLLVQAASECNEVAHRITKALHFGLNEAQPGQYLSNAERIVEEYIDLLASIEMLIEKGPLQMPSDEMVRKLIEAKKTKVSRFMEYARHSCGTLE